MSNRSSTAISPYEASRFRGLDLAEQRSVMAERNAEMHTRTGESVRLQPAEDSCVISSDVRALRAEHCLCAGA